MKFSQLTEIFKQPKANFSSRPLHCLFYSHSWTIYCLQELGLLNPEEDIIIELASPSNLSAVLNPNNNEYENLLALLQPDKHLHQLGGQFKQICAPVVLAPAAANRNDLLAALALVGTDLSHFLRAVVLVHVNDAADFHLAYAHMASFGLVWDVADYPNANLPALAEILVGENYLDQSRWSGIHFCNHKQRQSIVNETNAASLRKMLAEFPALSIN